MEAFVGRGHSTAVRAYDGDVENLRSGSWAGVGVRVISGGRLGFASAGTIEPDVLVDTLAEARANAAFAEPDEHVVLAIPDGVRSNDLDRWDEGVHALTHEERIERAIALERSVCSADKRITGVRSAAVSDGWGERAIVSTAGIEVSTRATRSGLGVTALAVDGEETQTGSASDAARGPGDLDDEGVVADVVARATAMLGATKPVTAKVTAVLEPRVAASFVGIVAGTLSGDRVVKGRSPFADRLGEPVAASSLSVACDPTDCRSMAAAPFDGEGLACRRNELVSGGVLRQFLYDTEAASRAGATSTASAVRGYGSLPGVGVRALTVVPGSLDRAALLSEVGDGIWVLGCERTALRRQRSKRRLLGGCIRVAHTRGRARRAVSGGDDRIDAAADVARRRRHRERRRTAPWRRVLPIHRRGGGVAQRKLTYSRFTMSAVDRHPHLAEPRAQKKWVRVDFHSHTMFSGDSTTTPDELTSVLEETDIDVLCITDHNTIRGAVELQHELPCRVIVGEELKTHAGEIIGLFLDERIPQGTPPHEACKRIRDQGGIVYVPHPFDPMRNNLAADVLDDLVDAELIDGIEAYNAKTSLAHLNRQAATYADERGLLVGAGSDAHVAEALGAAYLEMPDFDDRDSFLSAMSDGVAVGHHFDAPRRWRPRIVPSTSAD